MRQDQIETALAGFVIGILSWIVTRLFTIMHAFTPKITREEFIEALEKKLDSVEFMQFKTTFEKFENNVATNFKEINATILKLSENVAKLAGALGEKD